MAEVDGRALAPEAQLRELIRRIVEEYADAQHAHRVLTEDVKFLERGRPRARARQGARGGRRLRARGGRAAPDLTEARLAKPLTMLLFGMINWMFTWMKPDGALDHEAMAPIVADLFLGGLPAVKLPRKSAATVS